MKTVTVNTNSFRETCTKKHSEVMNHTQKCHQLHIECDTEPAIFSIQMLTVK
jgi:hypothetical protein